MKKNIGSILLLFFLCCSCSSGDGMEDTEPSSQEPPVPKESILSDEEIEALGNAGVKQSFIENMVKAVSGQQYPNIHSILIVKDKELVFERYFPGEDQDWGFNLGRVNHTENTLHDVRSISKSVVAACVGIAIDKGLIESVEQKIFDFFPEYNNFNIGLRSEITIKDLLTMTPGMQWDETTIPYTNPANGEIQMTNSEDPVRFVLSVPIESQPGDVFVYNGGATQLLAAIVANASGMQVDQFAEEFLFTPLGIENFVWHHYSKSGIPAAASGLRLRSRDLMKFGLLYHNKGIWEGDRVLSESWIEESFEKHIDKPNQTNGFFGYHFHIHPSFNSNGKTIDHVAAVGNGDQRIYFNEEDDLMVVFTAGNYNQYIPNNSLAVMKNFIYPSFL
ncbi:serine hydrolase domain-containing protein [Allomuricauda sp. CP2A]|uniref:serine hydrolase domain-containing protein n=1 Tax=Allomuricauda sp. CP2A TaxID=1848189 RepID=UPI00082EE847|nr:serine hydrolase [Muricauda sp. CP2A]